MISSLIQGVLLSALSLLWLVVSRPRPEWRGDHAAQFAAALILLPFALLLCLTQWLAQPALMDAQLVLRELSYFAAFPLLVVVTLCSALGQFGILINWDRMIWGRILLGICVIYEVCRRSDVLDTYYSASMVLATLILLGTFVSHLQKRRASPLETILVMLAACLTVALFMLNPIESQWHLIGSLSLLFFWNLQQIQRQQKN